LRTGRADFPHPDLPDPSVPGMRREWTGSRSQRVYEKARLRGIKTPEHQINHGHVDPRLARPLRPLVILAQPPVATQPRERPLHDPTPLQHLELLLLTLGFTLGPYHHLQDPAADLLGPLGDPAVVDPIGQDLLQPRELAHHPLQDELGPVAI